MSTQPCNACTKTVYPTEKVEAAGKWYHKGCFKCADPQCGITLNLKTFKVENNQIWCEKHLPKPKHTAVADSVSIVHAMHAPKKVAEGLHKAQVGTGETPSYGLDTIQAQHALNAPKVAAENIGNVQKGFNVPGRAGSQNQLGGSSTKLAGSQTNLEAEQEA
ncbi:hypothetical protein HK097_011033 [Rhizophlyctis rosea]|uniref:LIM zinc-binding domain-containing protein n=1 Tax=Rhizophlyctis rosea TaxID=64517 RepID=A0AAD5S8I4_9FUNG|nr:hypothetical protein HK097_011033 [Rhizophlyctis rosea]